MTAYIKSTDFLAKDSLPLNSAAKYVKGSEIDTEFNNIASADADNLKVSALGTGVETALGVNIGSAGAPVVLNGALGTPSSGTLTNATGLPAAGVVGTAAILGTNTFTAIQKWAKGADVASANALTLGTDGNYFDITGTTTITSIGTVGVGTVVRLHFDGILTLTHHSTDLVLPGAANITTAAGDEAEFVEYATGDWRCTSYTEAASRIQTCWVPAGAMVARTTNGAAPGSVETATNKNMIKTLDFDTTTAEYAQFSINMPKSWDRGTVTAAFVWSHAATTTNFGVAWELAGVAVSDDDALDVAFGTAGTVTDTGGTTNDCYITAATSAITIAGTPAVNDLVMFQVNRAPANGSDTMAIDARLHGVRLMYTIAAGTDA